jgi:RNA polymerase sigma factor (sigma-70 family)
VPQSFRGPHGATGGDATRADAYRVGYRQADGRVGDQPSDRGVEQLVTCLYQSHGLAMVRVALLLVGEKATAEDVVQDAFIGLYQAIPKLKDTDKAVAYLRASVVNGCRSIHRGRRRALSLHGQYQPDVWSAESAAMVREDARLTLGAVSRLPRRAREVLALRYYLDMSDQDIAAALAISRGNVSATASRALAALARELKEAL